MKKRFKMAFTMAEILVTLTIIGVIAAITLPSLSSNINERTLNTKRIALYSRLSQALGLIDSVSDVGKFDLNGTAITDWTDTAALTFVINKISQGIKIENTCDADTLKSCGFADVILKADGGTFSMPDTFEDLVDNNDLDAPKTKPAAFVTKNGESVAVYYNPDCMAKTNSATTYMDFVCVNIIYDLNGLKAPNTVGKDIGVATILYANNSEFVMPLPTLTKGTGKTQPEAATACSNANYALPTRDELISLAVNNKLLNSTALSESYWSSSLAGVTTVEESTVKTAWSVKLDDDNASTDTVTSSKKYICVNKMVE